MENRQEKDEGQKQDPLQLGQHFLKDRETLELIVESAELKKHEVVFEIGFGQGNLTQLLAEKCRVIAVEADTSFTLDIPNVKVKYGNALELIKDAKFTKFVSNIPYHISEPLMKKLLIKKECTLVVMLVPDSFASLLLGEGKLGSLSNAVFKVEKLADVPKSAFYPEPDTDSAVVRLARKKDSERSPVELLLCSLLEQHDKKIKNALEKHFEGKLTKRQVKEKLAGSEKVLGKGILAVQNADFHTLLKALQSFA